MLRRRRRGHVVIVMPQYKMNSTTPHLHSLCSLFKSKRPFDQAWERKRGGTRRTGGRGTFRKKKS
jgi:hypothetical protein